MRRDLPSSVLRRHRQRQPAVAGVVPVPASARMPVTALVRNCPHCNALIVGSHRQPLNATHPVLNHNATCSGKEPK